MPKRPRDEAREYVRKTAKGHDVKFIRLWFTDILGFLKSFAITVEELEGRLRRAWASTVPQSKDSAASTKAT
jgi:glutamine synthetase